MTLPVAAILVARSGRTGPVGRQRQPRCAVPGRPEDEPHRVAPRSGFGERGRGRPRSMRKHKTRPSCTRSTGCRSSPTSTISGTGIFDRYPELKGKGPQAHRTHAEVGFAACFSEPKTAEILAQWFESLSATPGVEDINVWLSEIEGIECRCRCGKVVRPGDGRPRSRLATGPQELPERPAAVLLTQEAIPRATTRSWRGAGMVGITYYSSTTPTRQRPDDLSTPGAVRRRGPLAASTHEN